VADVVAIGLRALASASALLAAGHAIFVCLHGRLLESSLHRIRSRVLPAALAALALTALHMLVEPVRLVGAWSGIFDRSLHALLLFSDFGTTITVRALGLLLIAASSRQAGRAAAALAIVGATLVTASFTLMGHTAADDQRWLLAPLLFVHLVAIAFWFGSLGPMLTVTRVENPSVAGAVLAQFSGSAAWLVPLILLAGLAMSGLLLPGLSGLATPYGLSLAAKVGGFALLLGLASLNKWRLAPGIARGDRSSIGAFRVSVLAEWVLILAVVTVTAVMTALFTPH